MAFKDSSIYLCSYCGEIIKSKAIYCKNCATQPGRKANWEANVAIAKENMSRGFTVPTGFPNWAPRVNAMGEVVRSEKDIKTTQKQNYK